MGLVLGSRKKEVTISLSVFTAFNTGERRSFLGESIASMWGQVVVGYGWRTEMSHIIGLVGYSMGGCMLLSPLSSDGVANKSDTVLTTSWPGQ